MNKFLEKNTPLFLFLIFLIFYSLQVPQFTCKADIIAFVARSLNEFPIINYAYLDPGTLLSGESLPNYHLGHTFVLWILYQLIPQAIESSILPAGYLSAVLGAFSIVITYLIWTSLGIEKRASLFTAICFGLVPTFWEHSTIGEIHTLQILFILLFIYTFIRGKYILSVLTFLIANLISPLSGLALSFILLKGLNKKNIFTGVAVALAALVIYIIIYWMIGANFLALLNPGNHQPSGRGLIYRVAILAAFILLNFNFFTYFVYKGILLTIREKKQIVLLTALATIPQFLLAMLSSGFVIEYGSFQLLLFWALSLPLGYYLSTIRLKSKYFIFSLIISFALTIFVWLAPHRLVGESLYDAAKWLKNNSYTNECIVGPWNVGISLIFERNGKDLDALNNYYYDIPYPSNEDLNKINKDRLILLKYKKLALRNLAAKTNIPGLAVSNYSPLKSINIGRLNKIYENDVVSIYYWEK